MEGKLSRSHVTSPSHSVVHSQSFWSPSERRVWILLLFIGLIVMFANRMSVPVTIVAMAEEMGWDKKTCGIVLSSFYWGYILPQVVAGHLSDRYGGDLIQWVSGLVWSTVAFFIAYAAYMSEMLVVLARFIIGLSQGMHYPALMSLMAHHVPEGDRSTTYGVISTGSALGSLVMGILGSFLLSIDRWPFAFIIVGASGLAWVFALRAFSLKSRSNHRTTYKLSETSEGKVLKLDVPSVVSCGSVPWRKILVQPAVLALFCAHLCDSFFLHNMLSWAPTYFHETFPHMQNSAWLYNVLPWVFMALGSAVGGWTADWMAAQSIDITVIRKVISTWALGGSCFFLLLMAAVGQREENFNTALLFIVSSCFCIGACVAGPTMNASDLAPAYTGAVYGLMNTIGTIPGILGVSLTGYLLHSTSSWALVFLIMAGTNISGLLIFLVFGSGKKLQLDS